MADSTVTLGADLAELRRALGTIPNQMDKEAAKMLANLEKAVRRAEKSVQKSAAVMDKAMKERMTSIRQGSTAVFGGIVGDVEDVGKAILALGPVAGGAAAALLAMGGSAIGIGVATAAVVGLVASSDDLIARLDEIGRADVISPEQTAQLDTARDGLESVKDIAAESALVLAAEFGPAIEKGTQLLVGIGIKGREALESITKHVDLLTFGLDVLTGGTISQAKLAMQALGIESTDLGKAAVDLVESVADEGAAYIAAGAAARDLAEDKKTVTGATRGQTDAIRDLEAALRQVQAIEEAHTPRAVGIEAMFAEIDAVNALALAHKTSAEIQGAAYLALQAIAADGERQAQEIQAAELERIAGQQAAAAQATANAAAFMASTETMAAKLVEIRRAAILALAEIGAQSSADLAGGIADLAGALADSGKLNEKAAMTAYKIAKAAGLTQVAISTAIAIAKAMELGPIFGPIAAVGAAAAGAAQAVAIQSTPPPSFFAGGGPLEARHPDATTAILHRGERVQPAASVRRDDRGDMRASMSGAAAPAPVQIQIMYGGRALDTVVSSEAQRPGSALRQATGTPRLGQRTR